MIKKTLFIICILLVLLTTLSGCYDARGVEELAYVTALGLDLSEKNILQLTLQISIPSSSTSLNSDSSQSSQTDTITVECESLNSGLALINSYISKEIDLSHCKAIIISENLAKSGLSPHIETISNNIEIRPNCNVIITKCSAKDYIENSKPTIESLTARYYEVAVKSSEYTGYIPATKLIDFIGNISNNTVQASAILGNLNTFSSENLNSNSLLKSNNNYFAGETPSVTSEKNETFGTAVFYDDKLVGELSGFETILHLIVSNKIDNCTISVPNIFEDGSITDLKIRKRHNTKINVDYKNNVPNISVEIFLEGYGLSLDKNINYDSKSQIDKINYTTEEFLKDELKKYLYKTSKELNSDIDGFGKKAIMQYLTIDKWLESNWLENYKNSIFTINVHMNIIGGNKFNQSP